MEVRRVTAEGGYRVTHDEGEDRMRALPRREDRALRRIAGLGGCAMIGELVSGGLAATDEDMFVVLKALKDGGYVSTHGGRPDVSDLRTRLIHITDVGRRYVERKPHSLFRMVMTDIMRSSASRARALAVRGEKRV